MVTITQHISIDRQVLDKIIEIKSLSWNYPAEEHLAWIRANLKDNDWHVLMYDDNELIGYLNLVQVNVDKGDVKIPFLGIGNVCTRHKGRGDGLKLMNEVNCFIEHKRAQGLLFCKSNIVQFYVKAGWESIKNLHPNNEVITMTYNNKQDLNNATYEDRLF